MGPGCNSGVFLRTTEFGRQSRTGLEIQIYDDAGEPVSKYSSGAIYAVAAPKASAARNAGEWNSLEATLRGRTLKVTLNDTVVQDIDLDDPAINADLPDGHKMWQRAKRGYIGLQNHGRPIRFRNIRLK